MIQKVGAGACVERIGINDWVIKQTTRQIAPHGSSATFIAVWNMFGDEGLKPLHVEYGVGSYFRRFTLGEAVDREGIKAQAKHGVLELRLPKAERARVRRIEVKA